MSNRLRSSTRASTAASESLAETMSEIKSSTTSKKSSSSSVGLSGINSLTRPLKKDELAKLRVAALLAMFAAGSGIATLTWACLNDHIKLYSSQMKVEHLTGYVQRAEYAIRHQTILVFWLLLNIFLVIGVRVSKKAINPLIESTEKHATQIRNILTNSYEQIILSVLAQLAFCSFATPTMVLKLIPLVNLVMFVGRVTFYAGYPMFRTFGFMCSLLPNLMLISYNIYRMAEFYKLF